MYQVSTGGKTFEVDLDRSGFSGKINGSEFLLDVAKQTPESWHVLHNNTSYNVYVVKADEATKTFTISVNGKNYDVKAKDDFDLLLDKMGLANLAQTKVNNLKAPMPGLVLDIMVTPGQEVKKDMPLLILEAMKMENVLKSPTDGIVKSVGVEKGMAVEKNFILITFA